MLIQKMNRILLLILLLFAATAHAAQTVTYFHNDVAGTPLLATDASGNVVWKENYYPYGERLNRDTNSNNKLWFTGKPYDNDTGLTYLSARYYNPLLGRFMGVDPKGFDPENIHSFNRYAYANNNPYRYVDPDGHTPLDLAFLVYNIGKLGVALYTGQGAHDALIDVGFSALGVISPIPGMSLARKATKIAESGAEVASAAHKASSFIKSDALQAILHTKSKHGNFNIGSMTRTQMDDVGTSWVGPNARAMMKNGDQIGWATADGLKTYRFPQMKSNGVAAGSVQGNLTEYLRLDNGKSQILRNAHIDLLQ